MTYVVDIGICSSGEPVTNALRKIDAAVHGDAVDGGNQADYKEHPISHFCIRKLARHQ